MSTVPPRSGGQAAAEALLAQGIDHAFCVPGESFLGLLDALYDTPAIRVVATRHEGAAAFMAEAYAKASGRLALCMATRGVGATNLSIGVHTALQDSTPLLAILGQVNRSFRQREAFQEVDLVAMFRPLAKWAVEVDSADRLPELIHRAAQIAVAGRPGPVVLSLPQDVLTETTAAPVWPMARAPRARPAAADVDAAIDMLLSAERPAILVGGGLRDAAALAELAELLETPVAAAWRRGDRFPNAHRLYIGMTGLAAPPSLLPRLMAADALLVIGSRLSENASYGYQLPARATRVAQIDAEPNQIGYNYPPAVAMACDAGLAVEDLLAAARRAPLPAETRAARRASNDAARARYIAETTPRQVRSASPVDYEGAIADIVAAIPPEAIVVSDVGNFAGWLSRYVRFAAPRSFIAPTSGAMGYGIPAAIATKLAHPGRPVIACCGDGSLMMTLPELETAVRARANIVVLVFDNQMYGTIRMHQELDYPGRVVGTDLATPDLAATAESFGALGLTVRDNAELPAALAAALAADRPALIHMHMDPAQIAVGRRLERSPAGIDTASRIR